MTTAYGSAARTMGPRERSFGRVRSSIAGRQRVLLLALLAIVVFKLQFVLGPLPGWFRPALALTPIALAFTWKDLGARSRSSLFDSLPIRLVLAYLGWGLVSIATSLYPSLSLNFAIGLVPLCALTIIIGGLPASSAAIDWVVLSLMYGGALLGIAALLVGANIDGRLMVAGSLDPNDLGAMMAMTGPLALGVALRKRGLHRLAGAFAMVLAAYVITRTDSRGSSIGWAVGMTATILMAKGRQRIAGLALLFLGAISFWALAPERYKERILTLGEVGNDYNATDYFGRREVWRRGLRYTAENPLFGVGLAAYEVAEGNSLTEQGRRGKWSNAHNAYVQAFAELGVPGGLILIALILTSVALALRSAQAVTQGERIPQFEIAGAAVGFAAASFFLSFAYSPGWFALWGLTALALRVEAAPARSRVQRPRRTLVRKPVPATAFPSGFRRRDF